MNIYTFFAKWKDSFNDFDKTYGSQCVDVIKQFFQDVLLIPPIKGNAIDYWRDIPGFTRIKKTPFNRPQTGDLVVWNINLPYGHIGICNWTSFIQGNCFEQNFPLDSPCHFQTHSYRNILGWLRPQKEVNGV